MNIETGPIARSAAVTLDATFPRARGIYVGTSGDLSLVELNGATALYKNVPGGAVFSCFCTRVNSNGTTATDLRVVY